MQGQERLSNTGPSANAPQVYAGADVCKDWLDVYFYPIGRTLRLANNPSGLKQLKRELAGFQLVLVVMEATGKYHRLAQRSLHASGFAVAVVNPSRPRFFAGALGFQAKTDRIDARMLALYGEAINPRLTPPCPQNLEDLQELVAARVAAVAERTALGNQLGAARTAFLRAELSRRIKTADTHIKRLEREINRMIAADPVLLRRREIIQSIPGVGPVAAIAMAVGLAEMGSCSNKKIALLAGLAPIADDSGDSSSPRHIKGGRGHVRTAIYMAAVAAAHYNSDFKVLYHRLIAAGKKPKVALTAIMRKLVVLANTLITENRIWTPIRP